MRVLFLICPLILAGCVSEADQRAAEQQFLAEQKERCSSYGYKAGSSDMAHCMERGAIARQQAQAADQQATQAAIASMNQADDEAPGYQVIQPTRPIHCTSVKNGVYVNTNCQ